MPKLPWISSFALMAALAVHAVSIHLLANSSSVQAEPAIVTVRQTVTMVSQWREKPSTAVRVEARIVHASTAVQRSIENLRSALQTKVPQETQGLVVAQPSGPHYFRLSDLTQKPVVKHDVLAGLVLHHPGLPPQPVILRLLISDDGKVDRILVEDSYLGSDIERQVKEALSSIMFEPGKIGRIAVRSQLRVEARLEPLVRPLPTGTGSAS